MPEIKLGGVESRFAEIIWKSEPISSGELVKLCAQELSWKKSTVYTVLRKLCERGLFQNQNGMVTSSLSKQEFYAIQGEEIVKDGFQGSLPAFIAAFTKRKTLTAKETAEIRRLIDSAGKE